MKLSKEEIAKINAENKARAERYASVPIKFKQATKEFANEQIDYMEYIVEFYTGKYDETLDTREHFNSLRDKADKASIKELEKIAREVFLYGLEKLKDTFFVHESNNVYKKAMEFFKSWYDIHSADMDITRTAQLLEKFLIDWENILQSFLIDKKGEIELLDKPMIKKILKVTDNNDEECLHALVNKASTVLKVRIDEVLQYNIPFTVQKNKIRDKQETRDLLKDIKKTIFKQYVLSDEYMQATKAQTLEQLDSLKEFIEKYKDIKATEDTKYTELSKQIESCRKAKHYINTERAIILYAQEISIQHLGQRAFNNAFAFYNTLEKAKGYNPYDTIQDYDNAISTWIMLQNMFEINEHGDIVTIYNGNIKLIARELNRIFFPNENKKTYCMSREKQIKFIDDCIGNFVVRTQALKVTKENIELIKMPHTDLKGILEVIPNSRELVDPVTEQAFIFDTYVKEGSVSFNSTEAHKLTGEEVRFEHLHNNSIRIVATSEDGISRMLRDKGLSFITVNVQDIPEWLLATLVNLPGDEILQLNQWIKTKIFKYGIIDKATDKLYMPAFQSPSSKRQANFMFVEVSKEHPWEDVKQLWMEATGYNDGGYTTEENFRHLLLALGNENQDGDVEINFSKFIARITSRGSNSIDISRINLKFHNIIQNANVVYTNNVDIEINRPWKSFQYNPETNESKMDFMLKEDENGNLVPMKRELTLGDGQMVGSFTFHAQMAAAAKIITEDEYDKFIELWTNANKDIKNVRPNSKLGKLIKKIPSVFQIRHGSKKGIIVRYNLEAIHEQIEYTYVRKINGRKIPEKHTIDLSTTDLICPDSVRKFEDGEWSKFPLEICARLKYKGKYVAMNPQFWQCLEFDDNKQINEIAEYWLRYMERSIDNPAYMMEYFKIKGSDEDDDLNTMWQKETNQTDSNIQAAIKANARLMYEVKIRQWIFAKYETQINDMRAGRVLVPGMYTYMICDPACIIAKTFDIDLPHLQSGEYYHNGLECNVAAFRSPLIWAGEAQKIKCQNHKNYWHMKDLMVFNGYDGIWDLMGGGDFDGDTCAVIPETGTFTFEDKTYHVGKWIVNGIRHFSFDVCEKGMQATKQVFNQENYIKYLVDAARTDRVGTITNYATKAQDVANHLKGLIQIAKEQKIKYIYFQEPKYYGSNINKVTEDGIHGMNAIPTILPKKHVLYKKLPIKDPMIITRGFMKFDFDKEGYKVSFCNKNGDIVQTRKKRNWVPYDERDIVGLYSIEDIEDMIAVYENDVMKLKLLQGREIDGAKTGVYAEGATDKNLERNDFTEEVMCMYNSRHFIDRLVHLGRLDQFTKNGEQELIYHLNEYRSLSPLGYLNEYVTKHAEEMIYQKLGKAKNYTWKTWNDNTKKFVNKKDENNQSITVLDTDIHGNIQYQATGTSLDWLLTHYITKEEHKEIYNKPIKYTNEKGASKTYKTLIEAMKDFDTQYSTKQRDLKLKPKELNIQESKETIQNIVADLTEQTYEELETFACANKVSLTSVAVAAYIACHLNDSMESEVKSGFAWVLIDVLLSVFARHNQKYTLYKLPNKENINNVSVKDNCLLVNNKPIIKDGIQMIIDAPNCNNVAIEIINERPYALVRKNCKEAENFQETNVYIDKSVTINFGMLNYTKHWSGKDTRTATADENYMALYDLLMNSYENQQTFCIVATPEYRMAIAVYDCRQKCYRIAADLVGFKRDCPFNIMWKKFKFVSGFDEWTKPKNGMLKSVRDIKARCVDIADEEAIALMGEDSKTFNLKPVYVN